MHMKHFYLLLTILLAACANDPYRNVYENIKRRNEAMKSPIERVISPTPSYDAYKKERERQEQD